MVPCDGPGQWTLGSREAVGIFQVAEDRALSLTPGTLCSMRVLELGTPGDTHILCRACAHFDFLMHPSACPSPTCFGHPAPL